MEKKQIVALLGPAAAVGLILILVVVLFGTSAAPPAPSGPPGLPPAPQPAGTLGIEDVKVGEGEPAKAGQQVTVHYTGTLTNGDVFDSSKTRGEPFTFALGAGQVIKGWDQGVAGMKPGGVRKLTIPPDLAYGPRAQGKIPPNSTLLFEVELLSAK